MTQAEPPWLSHARAETGVRTFAPGASNPRITDYHQGTNIAGYDDKAAWCSSFVHWCLARCGVAGTGSALARSWLEWGQPLAEPRLGCIAVLTRGDPAGWRGHVGFFVARDGDRIRLLGGNQQDSVCEHDYAADTVLGYRWPPGDDDILFTTACTRVRRLRSGDAAAMHRIYGDADTMRFVGDGQPLTLARCEQWVAVTQANVERRGYGMCAVMPPDGDEVIGCCGLVHPGGQADAEIKYALHREHWGRGIAGEVASALVGYGLQQLALPRIVATVDPAHAVSQRVLLQAGLVRGDDRVNDDGSRTAVFSIDRNALRLRRAAPDDAAALSRLAMAAKAHWGYAAADLERWRGELGFGSDELARGRTWLAEWPDGRIDDPAVGRRGLAGVVALGGEGERLSLEHLWVAPRAIGRGVGRALLSLAAVQARARGANLIEIDADPNAEAFYLHCGARRIGATPAPAEGQPERARPLLELPLADG